MSLVYAEHYKPALVSSQKVSFIRHHSTQRNCFNVPQETVQCIKKNIAFQNYLNKSFEKLSLGKKKYRFTESNFPKARLCARQTYHCLRRLSPTRYIYWMTQAPFRNRPSRMGGHQAVAVSSSASKSVQQRLDVLFLIGCSLGVLSWDFLSSA